MCPGSVNIVPDLAVETGTRIASTAAAASAAAIWYVEIGGAVAAVAASGYDGFGGAVAAAAA